ncbi:V(D)J recombination-activating protein 1 [Linum grandiflorum]
MNTPPPSPTNSDKRNDHMLFGVSLEDWLNQYHANQAAASEASSTRLRILEAAVRLHNFVGAVADKPEEDINDDDGLEGQRVRCAICRERRVNDPTATECGHVFCRICIARALKWKRTCPTCRMPICAGERALIRLYLS